MGNLFNELKRRNVVRVGVAYIVLGWVALQVGDILFDMFETPAWALITMQAHGLTGVVDRSIRSPLSLDSRRQPMMPVPAFSNRVPRHQ